MAKVFHPNYSNGAKATLISQAAGTHHSISQFLIDEDEANLIRSAQEVENFDIEKFKKEAVEDASIESIGEREDCDRRPGESDDNDSGGEDSGRQSEVGD